MTFEIDKTFVYLMCKKTRGLSNNFFVEIHATGYTNMCIQSENRRCQQVGSVFQSIYSSRYRNSLPDLRCFFLYQKKLEKSFVQERKSIYLQIDKQLEIKITIRQVIDIINYWILKESINRICIIRNGQYEFGH